MTPIRIDGRNGGSSLSIDATLIDRRLLGAALGDPVSWAAC